MEQPEITIRALRSGRFVACLPGSERIGPTVESEEAAKAGFCPLALRWVLRSVFPYIPQACGALLSGGKPGNAGGRRFATDPLFIKDGNTSRKLDHARGQIQDWKRYLEDNLATVQREIGLVGISANPNSIVVIGRSESLAEDNRRKLVTIENEAPRLKIMTYDDVYANAKAVVENVLGPLWNVQGNTQIYYLSEPGPSLESGV